MKTASFLAFTLTALLAGFSHAFDAIDCNAGKTVAYGEAGNCHCHTWTTERLTYSSKHGCTLTVYEDAGCSGEGRTFTTDAQNDCQNVPFKPAKPLSVVGLISSIVQFISFGHELFTSIRDLHYGVDLAEVRRLELIGQEIQEVSREITLLLGEQKSTSVRNAPLARKTAIVNSDGFNSSPSNAKTSQGSFSAVSMATR
ncbi:hypothetical protein F5Y16DRAFT_399235 [Xylariaceae sp. FL0255]|nr:hypothetical protein F5Y16DRAFT_399235 [Xylariaceae sp. FL0255]